MPKSPKAKPRTSSTAGVDARAEAQVKFGEARRLRQQGKTDKAIATCQHILRKNPDYSAALQLLGLLYMDKEDPNLALSCLTRAAMHNPDDHTILTSLAAVYLALDADEMADRTLAHAREIRPNDANTLFALGQVHAKANNPAEAVECFAAVVESNSKHIAARYALASCHAELGHEEQAVRLYESTLQDAEHASHAIWPLSQASKDLLSVDLMQIHDRLSETKIAKNPETRARLCFAKAAVFDRRNQHDEAWLSLTEANRLMETLNAPDHDARREAAGRRLHVALGSETVSICKPDTDMPVSLFLLGPSRSGKTTLEMLMSLNAQVQRGFESKIVQSATRAAFQTAGLLASSRLADLPGDLSDRFRDNYRRQLVRLAPSAPVYTNTNPHLVADVGRIAATVPNARFVFFERDTHDTALRMFAKLYKPHTNEYAQRLDEIAAYISWYQEMARAWMSRLPDLSLSLSYEAMVKDPTATIESVCRHCGIGVHDVTGNVVFDDIGCSEPYLQHMGNAIKTD